MIFRAAAKAFVQDETGNVLLLRRSHTHPRYALQWDIPGGFVEPEEEYVAALVRELREETGLELQSETVRLLYAKTDFYARGGTTGEPETVVRLYFSGCVQGERPATELSWEHDAAEWVTPADLADRLVEPFTDVVHYVTEHGPLVA